MQQETVLPPSSLQQMTAIPFKIDDSIHSLSESMYYLGEDQRELLEAKSKYPSWQKLCAVALPNLPCLVPARAVALACGFGTGGVENAEKKFGNYIWGTEFENVHSTWMFREPGFHFAGLRWHGSEQLFQAQKLGDVSSEVFLKGAPQFAALEDPLSSYSLGRSIALRPDWDSGAKDDAMRIALREKFTQSKQLKALLLATGTSPLVSVKADPYWGAGSDGQGLNRLGILLMELREVLNAQTSTSDDLTK